MTTRLCPLIIEIINGKQFTASQVFEYIKNKDEFDTYGCRNYKSIRLRNKAISQLEKLIRKNKLGIDEALTIEAEFGRRILEITRQYNEKMIPLIEKELGKHIGPIYF